MQRESLREQEIRTSEALEELAVWVWKVMLNENILSIEGQN